MASAHMSPCALGGGELDYHAGSVADGRLCHHMACRQAVVGGSAAVIYQQRCCLFTDGSACKQGSEWGVHCSTRTRCADCSARPPSSIHWMQSIPRCHVDPCASRLPSSAWCTLALCIAACTRFFIARLRLSSLPSHAAGQGVLQHELVTYLSVPKVTFCRQLPRVTLGRAAHVGGCKTLQVVVRHLRNLSALRGLLSKARSCARNPSPALQSPPQRCWQQPQRRTSAKMPAGRQDLQD